ncbi:MAG: PAS domain S-box protein, partial [Candidatus Dormiibacterota bacterium]
MTVSEPVVDLQSARLLDVVPDAILCVDGDGAIVYANAAAAGLFGYERDALVTLQLELLMPRSFRDLLSSPEAGDAGDPVMRRGAAMQLVARRKDGSEFAAEIMLTRTHMGGQSIVMVAPRDISERSRDAATFRGVLE